MRKEKIYIFFIFFIFLSTKFLVGDTLITKTGEFKGIIITKATFDKIYFYFESDPSHTLQNISRKNVKDIIYSKIPLAYQTAEKFFNDEKYKKALKYYKNATFLLNWSPQHSLYKIGLCYYNLKKYTQAIKSFNKLLKEYPNSFYKDKVFFYIGICFFAKRRYRMGYNSLKRAIELAKKVGNKEVCYKSLLICGDILKKKKAYLEAIKYYEKIENDKDYENFYYEARFKIGECYFLDKKYSEAIRIFKNLLRIVKNNNLFGKIYVRLGDYYLKKEKLKYALICYLKTILMYPYDKSYLLKAYKNAIYCCEILGEKNKNYKNKAIKLKRLKYREFGE